MPVLLFRVTMTDRSLPAGGPLDQSLLKNSCPLLLLLGILVPIFLDVTRHSYGTNHSRIHPAFVATAAGAGGLPGSVRPFLHTGRRTSAAGCVVLGHSSPFD